MSDYTIQNDFLSLTVRSFGAEMRSLKQKESGTEYLWNANPAFWGRTAPILFPLVGNYKNKTTVYKDTSYTLGQHGFARDSEFLLESHTQEELWFSLRSNEKTKAVYPFDFILRLGYKLVGRAVQVLWTVENTSAEEMYFSIGAHPAFLCDIQKDSLVFDTDAQLFYESLDENGLLKSGVKPLETNGKTLFLSDELFRSDALILEGNQTHAISLCKEGKAHITVRFSSPVVGLWSPAGKHAPFVCIEPWYGRTDRADFCGLLTEREWAQKLESGKTFSAHYEIETYM